MLPVTKDNSGNCLSKKITNGALWSEPALFQRSFMKQKNYYIMIKLLFPRFSSTYSFPIYSLYKNHNNYKKEKIYRIFNNLEIWYEYYVE